MAKYTFKQFQAEYPNDAACLAKLMEINYGGTDIVCPGCKQRAAFHPCPNAGPMPAKSAATTFTRPPEPSSTSRRTNLTKWFFAMYLMTSTRHGVAAKEVQRQTRRHLQMCVAHVP